MDEDEEDYEDEDEDEDEEEETIDDKDAERLMDEYLATFTKSDTPGTSG